MNELENPRIRTGRDLVKHVLQDIDDIVVKQATVDGKEVPIYRIQSDPSIFECNIDSDNCMGIRGGITKSVCRWILGFSKASTLGQHTIYFHSACSGGTRNAARLILHRCPLYIICSETARDSFSCCHGIS